MSKPWTRLEHSLTLFVGPYADEPATVEKMRRWAEANGYQFAGKHHEIYLGDPRRTAPEKLKTVLRHGVGRISE